MRPPLSNDRLSVTTDGKYRITLKRPWDDGTTHIVISGQELMAKLAVLIPPARMRDKPGILVHGHQDVK